jgi:hypothetical protein
LLVLPQDIGFSPKGGVKSGVRDWWQGAAKDQLQRLFAYATSPPPYFFGMEALTPTITFLPSTTLSVSWGP